MGYGALWDMVYYGIWCIIASGILRAWHLFFVVYVLLFLYVCFLLYFFFQSDSIYNLIRHSSELIHYTNFPQIKPDANFVTDE